MYSVGFDSVFLFDKSTPIILGIISPPFSTNTKSPTLTSNFSIISALCKDARFTVVPPNATGCKFATGVIAPVRPT